MQDLYYYLQQLANTIKKQEDKISALEKLQSELNKQLEELKNQPTVNIERIDYHFDQLKIERLDGTLNIGLNPADVSDMDEFIAGNINPLVPQQRNAENKDFFESIEKQAVNYLDNELPLFIDDTKKQLGIDLDSSITSFIQQDIQKQLKDRIQYYWHRSTNENPSSDKEQKKNFILSQIKQDIQQAVQTFLSQYPMKGDGAGNDFGSN